MERAKRRTQMKYQTTMLFVLGLVAATVAVIAPLPASAEQEQAAQQPPTSYGMTTGLVGIVQGQTARLIVWNKGYEAVLARLQIVDEQRKILILRDAIIRPGQAEIESFSIPDGTSNRVELQAQFGTSEKKTIGLLVPTLQVIDNATGANVWMIGPEGFVEIRPIWVPS